MASIAIYNNALRTWGGGEKNTYDLASALAAAGHAVEVLTFEKTVPTLREIEAFYGPGYQGFAITSLAAKARRRRHRDRALTAYLARHDVFINHQFRSAFRNPCPTGIYLVMFPTREPAPFLDSYQHVLCISDYTEAYVRLWWGRGAGTRVLYPCAQGWIGDREPPARRAREIVAIGRFTAQGHVKNQRVLVDAFEALLPRLSPGWSLTLIGKVNEDPETLALIASLRERSQRLPIRLELDAPLEVKRQALARAAVFWHGAGMGRSEPAEAHVMEHFGIAVVEAMCGGAIPLCYHRGGPREIVEHGRSGFLYRDLDELATYTLLLDGHPALREAMGARAVERGESFTRGHFDAAVRRIASELIPPCA